jgi:hypothetical protein
MVNRVRPVYDADCELAPKFDPTLIGCNLLIFQVLTRFSAKLNRISILTPFIDVHPVEMVDEIRG